MDNCRTAIFPITQLSVKNLKIHVQSMQSIVLKVPLNNKVKVARRVGRSYCDEDYCLTLVRYLSIPPVRGSFHRKT